MGFSKQEYWSGLPLPSPCHIYIYMYIGFSDSSAGQNLPVSAGDPRDTGSVPGVGGFNPWVGKIPWRRRRQPPPVSLPGKPHGERSLAGCSLWTHKELDTTERTQAYTYTHKFYTLNIDSCLSKINKSNGKNLCLARLNEVMSKSLFWLWFWYPSE